MKWVKKPGEVWSCEVGPFLANVRPKGDGRWAWQIFSDQATNPAAAGVASSLGAAKTVAQQFMQRSGRV